MTAVRRRWVALLVPALLLAALAGAPARAGSAAPRWFRVQFDRHIQPSDRSALARTGAALLQYSPDDAYLAYGSRASERDAAALAHVDRVAALVSAHKVDPALRRMQGVVALSVVSAPDAVQPLGRLGDVLAHQRLGAGSALIVADMRADVSAAARIAALGGVLYVGRGTTRLVAEDEGATQVLSGAVSATEMPKPGYEEFLAAHGLTGDGITIAVIDDGLDAMHPDLEGRIVARYSYIPENEAVGAEGHGTHVAGIIGGSAAAVPAAGRLKDANGLLYGLGVAPKVQFVDQPAVQLPSSTVSFPTTGGFPRLAKDALDAGAIAWNASWTDGGGAGAGYVVNAGVMDALVRDGDLATEGSQPLTMVFSAGNSGGPDHRITSPKEAKNVIVVASSRGHRAGDVDTISSFSSRGPAKDGRIVPTVTAPGETIMSARASTGVLCTVPLSANPKDTPPPDGLGLYTACSGTSMASPQVAGAVALIHEDWRSDHDGADSSPAMDKALLVNSAQDIGARDIPNASEGWGRVNLAELFDPAISRVTRDQKTVLTVPGQRVDLAIEAVDPSEPMRATLAWTDAPGGPHADPALVNDLNLVVVPPSGTAYRGNTFFEGRSVPGGEADELNNVENVFLDNPQNGTYVVRVAAANLPGDGVPDNGVDTDQDFALVISNARVAG